MSVSMVRGALTNAQNFRGLVFFGGEGWLAVRERVDWDAGARGVGEGVARLGSVWIIARCRRIRETPLDG